MLAILIGVAAVMLWSCHPSPSGRWLRRGLVERPAAWLSRVKVSHVVLVLVSLMAVAAAFHAFEGEGVRLVGSSVAEGAAWFIAFDAGTWLEAYAVLWLLGATRQVRAVVESARALVARACHAVRRACHGQARQASRRVRRDAPSRNKDPDPEGWLAIAA